MPLTAAAGVIAKLSVRASPARGAEELEELRLLAVVGTGRIAERRPDPAVALVDEVVVGEVLAGRVPLAPGLLVEPLGERLREAVGEGLHDDRAVVVVLALVDARELVRTVHRDGERAHVVARRRDEVREGAVRPPVGVVRLLAQEAEASLADDHVVAVGVRRPVAVDTAGLERPGRDDLAEEHLRVVVELAGGRVLEDGGELPLQVPRVEEELPVDERHELGHRRRDLAAPGERRRRQVVEPQVGPVRARGVEREQRLADLLGVLLAEPFLQLAVLRVERPRRPGSRSRETTSTTRLASSTCTVSLPYSGAMRTAVC